MNKRIAKKQDKRRNMNRMSVIINKIAERFSVTSKAFGNGYYIFTFGWNMVCHFSLKETPGWRYGIWLDKDNGFKLFGEHIDLIDKFKPTCAFLSFENETESFIEAVEKISDNPKLYFVASLTYGDALVAFERHEENGDIWYEGYQAERPADEDAPWYEFVRNESITQEDFVNRKFDEFYKQKEENEICVEEDRVYAFNFFKQIPSLDERIIAAGVDDRNRDGWSCSPRYDITIVVAPGLSSDEISRFEEEFDEIVRSKNYLEERKTFEHQFCFHRIYTDISGIKKCDYRFLKETAA